MPVQWLGIVSRGRYGKHPVAWPSLREDDPPCVETTGETGDDAVFQSPRWAIATLSNAVFQSPC